jgi:hypothetical protein
LPYLTTNNEIAHLAEGLPACMLREVLAANTNANSEAWLAFLREFTEEPEDNRRRAISDDAVEPIAPSESNGPLQKLAAGPWRSLGGYFDYSAWTDRERFRELDRAIAKAEGRDEIQDEPEGQII